MVSGPSTVTFVNLLNVVGNSVSHVNIEYLLVFSLDVYVEKLSVLKLFKQFCGGYVMAVSREI